MRKNSISSSWPEVGRYFIEVVQKHTLLSPTQSSGRMCKRSSHLRRCSWESWNSQQVLPALRGNLEAASTPKVCNDNSLNKGNWVSLEPLYCNFPPHIQENAAASTASPVSAKGRAVLALGDADAGRSVTAAPRAQGDAGSDPLQRPQCESTGEPDSQTRSPGRLCRWPPCLRMKTDTARLPESIIAAACSRSGQRVLHVDSKNYYGGNWASFSFSGLLSWIKEKQQKTEVNDECEDWRKLILENEEVILLNNSDKTIEHVEDFCFSNQDSAEDVEEAGALSKLPLFATSGAEGAAQELEKETIPMENTLPEKAASSDPASATEGGETEITSEGGSSPNAASGESDSRVGKTEAAPSENSAQEPKKITYSQIVREGRRFNIDLVSK
ncbi:PREDICTED: rab proteins geranylgeranyltransferase component A 1-like, partial [Tinamus guttatus]|uniref:rab proteins geranylgeranyltransferase component A 1-like n=1 Tax=Tinamus guttatus TaxID=94827 RepID=UPI00052F185F